METVLELTVAPDYTSWGLWESLREIFQNARDAHEHGFTMSVRYTPAKKCLEILNERVKIGKETLVLGGTTKRDDPTQRGKFGEGYKLACATLIRLGHKVEIHNDDELWIPVLQHSTTFNTKLLAIKIKSIIKSNSLSFKIFDVSEKDYRLASDRLLFIHAPSNPISTPNGTVLIDKQYRNQLYVKGIYVGEMDEKYKFGYDLHHAQLDRDRRLANPAGLRQEIATVLSSAVLQDDFRIPELYKIINDGPKALFGNKEWGEARAFSEYPEQDLAFNKRVWAHFKTIEGDNAIPVLSIAEVHEAEQYGFKGVLTAPSIVNIMSAIQPPFSELRGRGATDAKTIYDIKFLNKSEQETLAWACRLADGVGMTGYKIEIVDFKGTVIGTFNKRFFGADEIRIAKSCLSSRQSTIGVLVHELAHRVGADGTAAHRHEIERIFGLIAHQFIK